MKAGGFGAKLKKAFTDLMGLVKSDPKTVPVHESAPRRGAKRPPIHDAVAALTKRLGPPMQVEREVPEGRKPSDATSRGARVLAFTPSPRASRRAVRLNNERTARQKWRARLMERAISEGRRSWRWCHERVRNPVLPLKKKAA